MRVNIVGVVIIINNATPNVFAKLITGNRSVFMQNQISYQVKFFFGDSIYLIITDYGAFC